MKKAILAAAVLGAAALPSPASADTVCVGDSASLGACATGDAGCVVGSLKGYQYIQPCIRVQVYRQIEPPGA